MHLTRTHVLGVICLLTTMTTASGQRSFILRLGADPAGTPPGMTAIQAERGAVIDLAVWFEDPIGADAQGLNGYQMIFGWFAEGGTSGIIEYVDNNPMMGGGDSAFVDITNPDWIFANTDFAAVLPVSYNETPPGGPNDPIFGAIYNTLVGTAEFPGPDGDVPNPGGPNYIVQFKYAVSADACGIFTLPFNFPPGNPPFSAYFNPLGGAYGGIGVQTFQPLEITVGPLNDVCAEAEDLGAVGLATVDFDTTCATADGDPAGCDGGTHDIWYRYTTPVPCQNGLDVNIIAGGGEVTVYEPGATCTPAAGDELSCGGGDDLGIDAAGQTLLVRVSGTDVQGTLEIRCTGCTTAAECADGNPCTDDACVEQVCVNTPNTLPCDDGDPCTLDDHCAKGTCVPGPPDDCNDFNPCTADTCARDSGCENTDVNGQPCAGDDDCNAPVWPGVEGATCENDACVCTSSGPIPADTLRLEVRGCDNGPSAVFGPCVSEDSECNPGAAPDGILQCSDDDDEPLNGGVCVDQCCYTPGSAVVVDLELGPTPSGACGAQFFMNYDSNCLSPVDIAVDPDDDLAWDFVLVNMVDEDTGDIDLVVSLLPGVPCNGENAAFLGGTVAQLSFVAEGPCKCSGVDFRPHNPPTKITGPLGDIDLQEMTGTDIMQIQGPATISCPESTADDADCGTIFRTLTYGPVTVTDDCEEVTDDISELCDIAFARACQSNLDCGRGDLCGPNNTDCGAGLCEVDPLVDGAGLDCSGEPCTGYCTVDACSAGICETQDDAYGLDLPSFLDCSDGCQLPPGEISIACAYTNGCGRTSECQFSHYNSGLNQLVVDLELSPEMLPGDPNDPITRCIHFELFECDAADFAVCHPPHGNGEFCSPQDQTACNGHPESCYTPGPGTIASVSEAVVFGLPENLPGHGRATLHIPPGNWSCLTAADPKHSLASTCQVQCTDGNEKYAAFKGSKDIADTCHWLVQGNLDDNVLIDIADCAIMTGEYLSDYGTADTPCAEGEGPGGDYHADFNGDGLVTMADWTFVMFNIACAAKDPCSVVCEGAAPAAPSARPRTPRLSMTRAELQRAGLGAYVDAADRNADGVVDLTDMLQLVREFDDSEGDLDAKTRRDLEASLLKTQRLHRQRKSRRWVRP